MTITDYPLRSETSGITIESTFGNRGGLHGRRGSNVTTAIEGMWGIDDCVGTGACRVNNCGSPACSKNGWYMSYPNYQECIIGRNCNLNTSLPRSTSACGYTMNPYSKCVSGPFYAYLWECGPNAGQSSASGWCNPGGSHTLIACGNVALLTALANGNNPYTYGHVYAGLYVS